MQIVHTSVYIRSPCTYSTSKSGTKYSFLTDFRTWEDDPRGLAYRITKLTESGDVCPQCTPQGLWFPINLLLHQVCQEVVFTQVCPILEKLTLYLRACVTPCIL